MHILLSSLMMIVNEVVAGKYRHLFTNLAIIQKRQHVPFDVVERIWGLSKLETKEEIEVLHRFSILELSVLDVRGKKKRCIGLHDMFIDLARQLAKGYEDFIKSIAHSVLLSYVSQNEPINDNFSKPVTGIHSLTATETATTNKKRKVKMLLSRFKRIFKGKKTHANNGDEGSKSNAVQRLSNENKFVESWLNLNDDGYIFHNLFRLLHIAGLDREGVALLSNPRWIHKQLKECGWKKLDTDFAETIANLEEMTIDEWNSATISSGTTSGPQYPGNYDLETFLRMVRAALSESERHVMNSNEPGMLTTQLYGLLIHYREYKYIEEFLHNVEMAAPGPWIKASCAVPVPVDSSRKVLDICRVYMVRYDESTVEIVSLVEEKMLFQLQRYFTEKETLTSAISEWMLTPNSDVKISAMM